MHKATVEVYEDRGADWASRRKPVRRPHARAFAKRVNPGALRADLGCGAGRYLADMGAPAVGIDAAHAMLLQCREVAPDALLVQGDLEALPFKQSSLAGGWANMSYLHLPGMRLPMALADLHRVLVEGAPVDLQVLSGEYEGDQLASDDVGGRYFCGWRPDRLLDVMIGAGFSAESVETDADVVRVRGERLRTLPDFIGPDMRLLIVGLNPSLFAADAGVGYARASNRFWKAALRAGLISHDRDPADALRSHGVGMTDLVKRASARADEIRPDEFSAGMERIERLASWLEPKALCMVGLTGWRNAIDRHAKVGVQQTRVGSRPVYVMPSTSGANAHTTMAVLVEHLRAAAALFE